MAKSKKGKIVKRDDNSSPTTIPQFDGIDVTELYSIRNQALEESYNPTFNDAQKRSMKWVVKFLEDKIIEVSGKTWLSTGNLPSELTNIVFNPVAKRDTNKPQCDFKIEDWSDLIIKIGYKDTTFLKVSTHQTSNFKLSELGWNGLKLDILKALSVGIYKPKSDGISSRVYDLNRRIKRMVGMNINPIEKDYKNKCRISNVKIEVYDSDERLFDAQIKSDSMIGVGYNKEFDDGYDSNAIQDHLSHTTHDEDDEY